MRFFVFLLILVTTHMTHSQDFSRHQWEQRIILIQSPDFDTQEATEQLALLQEERDQWGDFKLLVYHQTNTGLALVSKPNESISNNSRQEITSFQVKLIGLDGGVKHTSSSVQPAKTFFELINSMPMRRLEVRKNKGKNE